MKNRTETGQRSEPAKPAGFGKDDVRYWKTRIKKRSYASGNQTIEVKSWQVRLYSAGQEEWFCLDTQNQSTAARKARDIYLHLRANGMPQTVEAFKPKPVEKTETSTLGEYIAAVEAQSSVLPETLRNYAQLTRQIVSQILDIRGTVKKYDYVNGGAKKWRQKIDSYKLEALTTSKINAWKKKYVTKAGTDPVKRKRAERTANSCLRNAKALFGKKMVAQIKGANLPEEIPFREETFFRQSRTRYRSEINIEDLIAKAHSELLTSSKEQYQIFILAVFVGLRRKEIDMLMWSAFDWDKSIIRIRPHEYHGLKSEASADDVPIEPEICKLFKSYHDEAKDDQFVIYSENKPAMKSYRRYRADKEFKAVVSWLRDHGVKAQKPIHTLRKEFGKLITEKHGIFAASKLLRHSSIQMTASYYADDTRHLTVGLGNLIKLPTQES